MSQKSGQSPRRRSKVPERKSVDNSRELDDEPIPAALLQCSKALARPVPGLRKRFPPETVVLAMMSQSAAFLRSLFEARRLTRKQTVEACKVFRSYVLQGNGRRS
jgi:hypothetical protein